MVIYLFIILFILLLHKIDKTDIALELTDHIATRYFKYICAAICHCQVVNYQLRQKQLRALLGVLVAWVLNRSGYSYCSWFSIFPMNCTSSLCFLNREPNIAFTSYRRDGRDGKDSYVYGLRTVTSLDKTDSRQLHDCRVRVKNPVH